MKIPKKMAHIWIGPLNPPVEWMNTWKEKHADWEYTLYDNNFLKSFSFKNKKLIEKYYELGLYAGAADLMRYEILYEFGGCIAEADSICYENIEELFDKECAYTVYENEFVRGKLVSPILACEPKNEFVGQLINELNSLSLDELDDPWISTGNLFVAKMIEKYNPNITIFPSHYFIPVHYVGLVYEGNDKVYAKQLFGSTNYSYTKPKTNFIQKLLTRAERKNRKKLIEEFVENKGNKLIQKFQKNFE